MDGKNVADFVDPEIEEKLDELEREEERLIAEGYYDSEEEMVNIYIYKLVIYLLKIFNYSNLILWNINSMTPKKKLLKKLLKKLMKRNLLLFKNIEPINQRIDLLFQELLLSQE